MGLKDLLDEWELEGSGDSSFALDRRTRLSVTGYVIFLSGAVISWKSKSQRSVTKSSTKAEYIAVSDMVSELMFIKQVLEFLLINFKKPITVKVDNVSAINFCNNATIGARTKHINIKYHYVQEYVENRIVQIRFVRTDENAADPFTKNIAGNTYWKHHDKYMVDME